MKRIIGLITVAALLVSLFAIPAYAFEDDAWSFEYAEDSEASDEIYGEISGSGAISGKSGLYLYNNMTETPVTAKSSKIKFTGGTEYTLSMWTKTERTYMPNAFKVGIDGVLSSINVFSMTKTEESGGNKRVEVSFTPDEDITSEIAVTLTTRFKSQNKAAYAVADDIEISSAAGTIYTCGFETIDTGGDAYIPTRFSSDRYPTNVLATGWYGNIGLSWVNPTAQNLEKIVVLDADSGEVIADSDSSDIKQGTEREDAQLLTDPGVINTLWVYDCEVGEVRNFKLRFIYGGTGFNNMTEYTVSGKALSAREDVALGFSGFDMSVGSVAQDTNFASFGWKIDRETVHSGDAALKIYQNQKRDDGSFVEFYTNESVTMEKGKSYRVSMWLKNENSTRINFLNEWSSVPNANAEMIGTNDWKEFTYDYTAGANISTAVLRWRLYGPIGALWLDDISVYELDENGEPVGDNLMTYGDFEGGYKEPSTADVSALEAENIAEGVRLSWALPEKALNRIKVYDVIGGEKTEIASLDGSATEVLIKDAILDTEHTYLVTTVNTTGFESEGVECSLSAERNGIAVTDIALKREGLYVSDINVPGEYTISLTAVTDTDTEKSVELFALYTDGGELKASDFNVGKIGKNSIKEYTCTINIDDPTDTDALKVFFWDSIEGMNTIKNAVYFE